LVGAWVRGAVSKLFRSAKQLCEIATSLLVLALTQEISFEDQFGRVPEQNVLRAGYAIAHVVD